ncbi:hypothetical protein PG995_003391 [Apiospora arundinis]|uniref:Apple domain-containing protein n=1 Tax=Apiospora arundinis TaxID=335852 RepID=A0ABR2HS52_9PEZI
MAGLMQLLKDRAANSRDPCPAADGTIFNAAVDFRVSCGMDMPKSDLAQVNANNFTHCMDICISWHPKCVGFGFDPMGNGLSKYNCWPKSFLAPAVTQSFIMDSAAATNLPIAADDCKTLGSVYSAKKTGDQFELHCGQYYAPGSLAEVQASSMGNCIDQCVQYNKDNPRKCVAVAYESAQNYGYLNCYLKQSIEKSGMTPNPNYKFDMAVAVAATATGSATKAADTDGPTASPTVPPTPAGATLPSWVVGAILGPILVLILAGLIFLYSWQKKQKKKADQPRPTFKLLSMKSSSSSYSSTAPASSQNHDRMAHGPSLSPSPSPFPPPAPVSAVSEMRELEAQQVRPGELEACTPHNIGHVPEDNSSRWKVARF